MVKRLAATPIVRLRRGTGSSAASRLTQHKIALLSLNLALKEHVLAPQRLNLALKVIILTLEASDRFILNYTEA